MTDQPEIDPSIAQALSGLPNEYAGFGRIFQDEIRPALQGREEDRVKAVAKARQSRWVGVLIALVIAGGGFLLFKTIVVAFFGAVAGIGYAAWGAQGVARIGKETKDLLVTPVVNKLGLSFNASPGPVASIQKHRELGVVPSWDRSSYEDLVLGARDGVDFELFEAHLEEKRTSTDSKGRTTTRWVTVFKGQCLKFSFDKRFYGRTLVTRDAGFFNRFSGGKGKGMTRAALEDPKFEKIFEVYTTDQVEARYLLTPDLMQELVNLEEAFHGGKLKCCFDGGELYITLQGGNLFEPGSMYEPLDNPARVRELIDDFIAVFHIIDVTNANRRRYNRATPTA